MHDDSCKEYARAQVSGLTVHCWLNPDHRGLHYDMDIGIYWRKGSQGVGVTSITKPAPPRRRLPLPRLAAV